MIVIMASRHKKRLAQVPPGRGAHGALETWTDMDTQMLLPGPYIKGEGHATVVGHAGRVTIRLFCERWNTGVYLLLGLIFYPEDEECLSILRLIGACHHRQCGRVQWLCSYIQESQCHHRQPSG